MVTVLAPVAPDAAKLPFSDTLTVTGKLAAGTGSAVNVKVTSPPSVTAEPPAIVIVGTSSSLTTTLAVAVLPTV